MKRVARLTTVAACLAALAAPAGARAADFRPIGPDNGLLDLAGGGGRIAGAGLGGIWLREATGWRPCTPLPRALRPRADDDALPSIAVAADGAIWVVGRAGLATGGPDCASWRVVPTPGGALGVVALAGPTAPVIAIQRGRIRRSDDGGRTWRAHRLPARAPERAVAGGQSIVIDDLEGPRACSSDGGRTWQRLSGGEFSDTATAIGGDGTIWSVDLGEATLDVARACGAPRQAVAGGTPGELVGADLAGRAVIVDEESGRVSLVEPSTLAVRHGPVLGPPVLDVVQAAGGPLVLGTPSGIFTVADGVPRRDAGGPRDSIDMPAVLQRGRRLLTVPLLGGDVVASDDRGGRWTPVVTGRDTAFGGTVARLDDAVVAVIDVDLDDPDDPPLAILRSIDAGRTWRSVAPEAAGWASGSIADDPASPTAWSVTDSGRLYRTRDAGRHWRRLRGRIDASGRLAARPGELVALGRGGGAWRITRVGRTGRPRSAPVSGLPATCTGASALVADPAGALVASACGRIYRSRDGRAFRRDAGALPASRAATIALVAERSGTRTWLGRADGLFVQAAPGARWRRVRGAPRQITALVAAADDLLVSSERGLEAVALR